MSAGARQEQACEVVGLSSRTLRRWRPGGVIAQDQRPVVTRTAPEHKLSVEEREEILSVCNEPRFRSKPPSQIVPVLADEGRYIGSESTMNRVLKEQDQLNHRGRAKTPEKRREPTTHVATGPNQLWSWDVTWLASTVRGRFFYLYLVLDVYSRKCIGYEVHDVELGELAAELMTRCVLSEQCSHRPPVLHSDNGSIMKSQTLLAKLSDLGISPSYSRARVSNDNAYSEALFRTLKYCPEWPRRGFVTIEDARHWVETFVDWYNHEHRHSAVRYITPAQRHRCEDNELLVGRRVVYEAARARNPRRWSGGTRNWTPVGAVTLNPERKENVELQMTG